MKCPACNLTLTRRPVGDLEVDVCRGGCGGLWFDNYELDKVDEQHEHVGEELLQIEGDPSAQVNHERERSCPRCSGTRLMRHFWSVRLEVEVDECPKCGGTWLDTGELASIRGAFPNEEARRQAAKKHFDTLFGPQWHSVEERWYVILQANTQ